MGYCLTGINHNTGLPPFLASLWSFLLQWWPSGPCPSIPEKASHCHPTVSISHSVPTLENVYYASVTLWERVLSWRNWGLREQKGEEFVSGRKDEHGCPWNHCLFTNLFQWRPINHPHPSTPVIVSISCWLRIQLPNARSLFEVEFHLCFDEWMYLNEQNILSHC